MVTTKKVSLQCTVELPKPSGITMKGGQITRFFKKKATGEEEEGKKTIFVKSEEGTIKVSIKMFRELEKGEECGKFPR